ncbi:nuclear transport factor 2 family protein [Zhongshania sp.]|uniref:nuclear transport factor 2 family protein n=1 Tax=Zhongshania sp. TaxID=1971902 RepID=UPI003566D550
MTDCTTIEDWIALSEAKARYCRFLDTKDWASFTELFTEDYEMDVSEGSQVPVIRGRAAAIKQVRASIETARTAHQVHSPEMDINGDEASVIWAMQDRVVWAEDKPSIVGYGHYHERWRREGGEWKIAALRLTRLHMDILPPSAT